ncbi:MAG: organic solvent tolerance protein [Arcobacter sp.]|nr:organic solvent tolerance protein [Arcobacter sp.]|tara:strand:- start:669 stop:2777 length:2109 start_codon:yes stop_codon:yes gene_type:complete
MLKKSLASLLLLSTLSFGEELQTEKFQIISENIKTENNIVTASGSVVVFSATYYLSASKIIYDKEKETFELFDNVLILKDNTIQTQSDYALINLKNDAYAQSPVMLFDKESNLWVNSKKSTKDQTNIELDSSIISSCDCVDPAWSIRVSSASYDTENKWMHAYNPRLYFRNVPVFYSPYLGFPTDTTRRTGLLPPTIGYSNTEGLSYSQSIFIAPKANYDLEIIPQIRDKRGFGVYSYFRYADSAYSLLKLNAGFFREKESYKQENDLDNQKHYGWSVDYERTKLLSSGNHQDGLYASINWLNDIEYDTLEEDDDSTSSDEKVESKINYFYNTPKYYGGIYGRYYIDTDLDDDENDETLQKLPELQFHSYNDELFGLNKVLYSLDSRFKRYTRKVGVGANYYEVSLPINYSRYFLDDYLYVNIENKSVLSKYEYTNDTSNYEDGTLIQNEVSVSVGTDLIKPYDKYLHTINIEAEYSHPKNIKEDGALYGISGNDYEEEDDLSSFTNSTSNKTINLSLNQSLYHNDNLEQLINHKLKQSILYNSVDEPKLQNTENYIKLNYKDATISNRITYNVQDKQFIENTISTSYKIKDLTLNAGYYKSKDTPNSGKEDLESYNVEANYNISKDYKFGYYENYNILEKIRSKQGINLNIDDKCWNFDITYERERVASSSDDDVDQKIIYLNLTLKPLGGIKQEYTVEDN